MFCKQLILFISLAIFGVCTFASSTITITLYFAGTGATEDWWDGEKAVYDFGLNGFWRPELLASLHRAHVVNSKTQYKKFINGIGTGNNPFIDMLGKTQPSNELIDIRGWQTCLQEAQSFVDEILAQTQQSVILNLVGWSRGAVSGMLLSQQLIYNPKIQTINIIAIDPVAGDKNIDESNFLLPEKVNRFVGIYAEDERSRYFTPVIPAFSSQQNVNWFVRLPGSHETLVGNDQIDGHAFEANCLYPDCLIEKHEEELRRNAGLVKYIITQLLNATAWGAVKFDEDKLKSITTPNISTDELNEIWQYNYSFMRKISFIPVPLTFLWDLEFFDESCKSVNSLRGMKLAEKNVPRCVKRYFKDSTSLESSLTAFNDIKKLTFYDMNYMIQVLQ